jgi:hypothetical protein
MSNTATRPIFKVGYDQERPHVVQEIADLFNARHPDGDLDETVNLTVSVELWPTDDSPIVYLNKWGPRGRYPQDCMLGLPLDQMRALVDALTKGVEAGERMVTA